ncbi:glycosyltransferase family 4 protein [Mesorhizobium sp. PAMC28654]|uniref:glycosyltransferase family 4 protein n=1 Tax=Mesorhizobium sp. PAMC28654 TaxID=2880934 RepID=UPI001D09A093|nr:glycosyltransferase family 4 protein [Mesorhizobium sp. PAMC28654]UDL91642.1 glycosyltransferase family 4 protein [Mesorhizobium sp. PAMC28654]
MIRFCSSVEGLGTVFLNGGPLQHFVEILYRISLKKAVRVFFLNPEDMEVFTLRGLVDEESSVLLPGTGVDLMHFRTVNAQENQIFRFSFIGRILWDKGIAEYISAARIVREQYKNVKFTLHGFLGVDNRSAIPKEIVAQWESEGVVDYIGSTDDIRDVIAASDCIVLPSYREGLSRTLLEASAMAKPIIASDVPGCRDVVEHGVTGLLCRARDAKDLAEKMLAMLRMEKRDRDNLGLNGRRKMEREFDEAIVLKEYRKVIDSIN